MPLSDRLEHLQTALVYCTISNSLRKPAYWSIGIGAVVLAFGAFVSAQGRNGYVSLAFGAALVAVGVYLWISRNPWAVIVEGCTLAILALLGAWGAVSAYRNHERVGNPLGILFLAIGAWNMFSTYRSYKEVCEKADPGAVQTCKEQIDAVTSGQSDTTVMMESNKWSESDEYWAASFVDDLILFLNGPRKTFRKKISPATGVWALRSDVRVENVGDTWVGKRVKARLYVKDSEFLRVKLGREDFERLNNLLLGRAASSLTTG